MDEYEFGILSCYVEVEMIVDEYWVEIIFLNDFCLKFEWCIKLVCVVVGYIFFVFFIVCMEDFDFDVWVY